MGKDKPYSRNLCNGTGLIRAEGDTCPGCAQCDVVELEDQPGTYMVRCHRCDSQKKVEGSPPLLPYICQECIDAERAEELEELEEYRANVSAHLEGLPVVSLELAGTQYVLDVREVVAVAAEVSGLAIVLRGGAEFFPGEGLEIEKACILLEEGMRRCALAQIVEEAGVVESPVEAQDLADGVADTSQFLVTVDRDDATQAAAHIRAIVDALGGTLEKLS